MKNEEIRIAMAQACPSVFVRTLGQCGWNYRNSVAERVLPCIDGDPSKDLNAMREAALTLKYTDRTTYTMKLREVVVRDCQPHMIDPDSRLQVDLYFYEASAAQRAEAFLRTIGKWTETK